MTPHYIPVAAVVWLLVLMVKATVFNYQASIWTGTSVAMTATSKWSIRARVTVSQDIVQLAHAEVSVFSGSSTRQHYYVPLPVEASQLEQPFSLRYNESKLVGLSVVPGEDVWAVNLKRGLASLLQLDHKFALSPVFTAEENMLHGVCLAEYTSFLQENVTVIRKFVDHETCSQSPWKTLGQCVPVMCSQNPQAPLRSSSDITYRTCVHDGAIDLQSVQATSRSVFHLLMSRANHIIVVNQSLEREAKEEPRSSIHIPENMTQVGITFELPNKDLTQGRDTASQQYVYDKVTHVLKELSQDLDHLQVGADPDQHHKNLIASAIDLLLLAELPTLKTLFSSFDLGTSYQQETARNIFLDILPKVGSHESTLLMKDLIIGKKVRNTTAIHFLIYLPFHLREPSEDLLVEMQALVNIAKDFNDDMKSAVVLSFTNLINKTCKKACKPETLDSYIRSFLNNFTGSKKYHDQLMYLDALSNIEIGRVFDYLASIVRGNVTQDSPHPRHLRYRAMWAAASRASFYPDQVRELCWPVLMNQSESLDFRVAALTTLTISDPTPATFFSLFSYMQSQMDPHLYYHYYTTLQSLVDITFPCYKELGSLAREVLPVARKPAVELWGSGNYILDFSDDKLQFGSITHLLMIANKRTGFPNVFHFLLGTHIADYITTRTELFVRVEGVEGIAKEKLLQILKSTSSIPQLMDMLSKLDITPSEDEPLHIEVALNLHGCTVMSQYMVLSNWKEFGKELWQVMRTQFGAHVNSQESHILLMNGNYFPTSAGTLAFTRTQAVGLVSLRGDVAWEHSSLQTDLDISVFHSMVYELTTFNPVLNMWQASETYHTVRSHLVINNCLNFLSPLAFKFTVFQPTGSSAGLVWHKRTMVSMKGQQVDRTLRSLCPTCETTFDVITGNKNKKTKQLLDIPVSDVGSRLQVHILKCDTCPDDGSIISVLLSALNGNSKNYRILPSSRPLLVLMHFATHILVAPPEDIAGYSVQIVSTHSQLTELVLSTQLDVNGYLDTHGNGPILLHSMLVHKLLNTTLWAWDGTAQLTVQLPSDTYAISAEFIKTTVTEPAYSVCLQLESELQKSEDVLSVRNLLSNIVKSRGIMSWGTVGSDKLPCPNSDGRLDITLMAQASDEQKEMAMAADSWPYNACNTNAGDNTSDTGDWLLLDPACSQLISEISTPRKVNALIKYNNERNKQIIQSLFVSTAGSQTKEMVITAVLPVSRNEVEFTVNDYHTASCSCAALALPWLSNALLPASDSISTDWIHTCVINASNVRTFDNAFVEATVSTCYVVGAAEHVKNPTFAIMVRTLFGTNQLGLKIFAGLNYIEIITRNGCTTISTNDELVSAEETVKTVNGFGLFINKRGDTEIVSPPVIVVYKVTSVTIIVTPLLQGYLVGLCGDHNGDSSNDYNVHSITMTCSLE